uniref:SH3 domain-containing protein n=1 Tax=Amphimedon queenslandica TaxID=400682 RepID=A0A1X7TRK1_AMPQE
DDPASQILQHYSDRISQVSLTDSCIQLLYTEGLITEDTQRKIKRCGGSLSDTLRELMIAVSDDHSKLRSLGNIIMELEETKPLAQDIIKDCDEIINGSVSTGVVRPVTTSTVSHLPADQSTATVVPGARTDAAVTSTRNTMGSLGSVEVFHVCEAVHQYPFDTMRGKFGIFRFRILQIVAEKVSPLLTFLIFLRQGDKLTDGEEQELRTLLDYKEGVIVDLLLNIITDVTYTNGIGSIFEQDKQLNIIKRRKDYIERILQTPGIYRPDLPQYAIPKDCGSRKQSKLKIERQRLQVAINKVFKSHKLETENFRTSLLMKAGTDSTGIICLYYLITGREEVLVEYKKEIELLQENISITSVQLLMSEKGNIEKKDQCTQSLDTPTAESIYTARIDYHGIRRYGLSFSEGGKLDIYDKSGSFKWKGRSLVSGDEGFIPSSCVYSMLESLQFLEFILSVEEVSLPILQKIRNDSSSNDEKASLFLETINDDPIMISALRQDKEQHDIGVTGRVKWDSDRVSLTSPSPVQCNEVISNLNNNHKVIHLNHSSTNSTVSLLSSTKLHTLNLRRLEIMYTPLTNDCIQHLCILLTNNKTIQELEISSHSISDRGVTNICQALEHNSTLTSLGIFNNPLITSTSGQALSHLLLNNSSLVELNLRYSSLSTESILLIFQSLMDNKKIRRLWLDYRHKETCINTYPNYYLIQDKVEWRWL